MRTVSVEPMIGSGILGRMVSRITIFELFMAAILAGHKKAWIARNQNRIATNLIHCVNILFEISDGCVGAAAFGARV
jgi:hypothetical protein